MSGHEARINDALRTLCEEYRLGMVAIEEYRTRRRRLLESWGERDSTTAPGSSTLRSLSTSTTPGGKGLRSLPAAAIATAPPSKKSAAPVIVAIIAALAMGAGTWFVLSDRAQPPATNSLRPAAPAIAPPSDAVVAAKKAADAFLARNHWDPESIEGFLAMWQTLSAADKARALEEPSLRTLRYELEQNLRAETQLVAPDAPPEQRVRLDALTRLKNELGGA